MVLRAVQSFVLVLLILMVNPVYAGAGWTGYSQVAELTATTQGRFLVRLQNGDSLSGCSSKDTFYRDYGLHGTEDMYRTLLEAGAGGKKVRVYVTGRCDLNGYGEISSVSILL